MGSGGRRGGGAEALVVAARRSPPPRLRTLSWTCWYPRARLGDGAWVVAAVAPAADGMVAPVVAASSSAATLALLS